MLFTQPQIFHHVFERRHVSVLSIADQLWLAYLTQTPQHATLSILLGCLLWVCWFVLQPPSDFMDVLFG